MTAHEVSADEASGDDLNRALVGKRLHLQPLMAAHTRHLYEGLCDMRLYEFMPDEPPASVA